METTLYRPIATCNIPMPIDESVGKDGGSQLPRILRQASSMQTAARRVVLITVVFLLIAVLEGVLLFRLPSPEPLVVYHDVPRHNLLEPLK